MTFVSFIKREGESAVKNSAHHLRFVQGNVTSSSIGTLLLAILFLSGQWSGSFAFAQSQPYTFTTIAGLGGQFGYSDGTNNEARFYLPYAIAMDGVGNLFVGDLGSLDNDRIRKLTRVGTDWVVTTIAGPTGLDGPLGIAVDAAGNLFVANVYDHTIAKLTQVETNWLVTTIAGVSGVSGNTDGTNSNARFTYPRDVVVDTAGNVFVAQFARVRKLTPDGTNWVVTTVAGSGLGSRDGTNNVARFSHLSGIALENTGTLYVTDTDNGTIRKVAPVGTNWVVTTIAGLAGSPGSSDGTNQIARFDHPAGIDVDASGTIFVSDVNNHTIRRITPAGTNWIVTTIAGLARNSGTNDGTGSAARFDYPTGLIVDGEGAIYLAGNYDRAIRFGQLFPSLGYSFAGNQLILSWPTAASNYVLESSGVLGSQAVWSPLTNDIAVSGESFVQSNNLAAPAAFYRLRKP